MSNFTQLVRAFATKTKYMNVYPSRITRSFLPNYLPRLRFRSPKRQTSVKFSATPQPMIRVGVGKWTPLKYGTKNIFEHDLPKFRRFSTDSNETNTQKSLTKEDLKQAITDSLLEVICVCVLAYAASYFLATIIWICFNKQIIAVFDILYGRNW